MTEVWLIGWLLICFMGQSSFKDPLHHMTEGIVVLTHALSAEEEKEAADH